VCEREREREREMGGSKWKERKEKFLESSLVDFPVRSFPQPVELTPNKGRRGDLYFFKVP
jgi:hypothetical protein